MAERLTDIVDQPDDIVEVLTEGTPTKADLLNAAYEIERLREAIGNIKYQVAIKAEMPTLFYLDGDTDPCIGTPQNELHYMAYERGIKHGHLEPFKVRAFRPDGPEVWLLTIPCQDEDDMIEFHRSEADGLASGKSWLDYIKQQQEEEANDSQR